MERIKRFNFECCKYFCNAKEVIIETELKMKIDGQEMDVSYFTCPKCNKIYLVEMLDEKAVKMKFAFKQKLDLLGLVKEQHDKAEVLKELNGLRAKQKEYQDSLKNKYEKSLYLVRGIGTTTLKWKGES